MFSFVMFTIFWLKTHRYIITTHDECHKGKAVRNYSIKMSVHFLLSTQTIRVQNHPDFNRLVRGSAFGRARHLGIPKHNDLQSNPSVSSHLAGWAGSALERGHHLWASPAVFGQTRVLRTKTLMFPHHCDEWRRSRFQLQACTHYWYILSAMNITSLEQPWGSGIGLPPLQMRKARLQVIRGKK